MPRPVFGHGPADRIYCGLVAGYIHPWIKAYLGVFEHPYFALSGADGRFTLKDLPPGEYTIEAWHERFGTRSQKVALGPKETKEVEFAFAAG